MNVKECEALLLDHGIRPTVIRILVLRQLVRSDRALSLHEMENSLLTVDKSNIFRTLALFHDHHLIHVINDGEVTRYEQCRRRDEKGDDDLHPHFFCKRCHRLFCLADQIVPAIILPEGFTPVSTTFIVDGICSECGGRERNKLS